MRTVFALGVIAGTLFIASRPASATSYSFASYLLQAFADDPGIIEFSRDNDEGMDSFSEGTKTGSLTVTTTEGQSSATGSVKYKVGNGVISLYANGDAQSRKPLGVTFAAAGAGFYSSVSGGLSDVLRFTFPENTNSIQVSSSVTITADLATGGSGVTGSIFQPNDEVGYLATAYLKIDGLGIPVGPHSGSSGGQEHYWAYQHRSFPPGSPIEVVNDQPLTTTTIPVMFEATRNAMAVRWEMSVVAAGSVENRDHTNFVGGSAFAISDLSHTLRWGGITSVVDADTGEPITDWTLTSESGFDWTHAAVPEPSSGLAILIQLSWATVFFGRRTKLWRVTE